MGMEYGALLYIVIRRLAYFGSRSVMGSWFYFGKIIGWEMFFIARLVVRSHRIARSRRKPPPSKRAGGKNLLMVELIVNMDCHGCERKVRKALQSLDGVENIEIDLNLQKVTVTGSSLMDQEKVLKKVRRTGKKAELWPFPENPETIGFTEEYGNLYSYHSDPTTYFHTEQPDMSSHKYYKHSYNGNYGQVTHQELPYSSTGFDEKASNAFSDENVNACSIM
ncbi:heavy metal-associated isoprenylated plant protein 28-like [Rutidosis leptorrhynchoides]|uniref:heavy metal-associated isoprenylated plant protein 28-like n=1 Tax=Rutidosis leptorrhynchoides TaxID=125765 RepID=UPI003A99C053